MSDHLTDRQLELYRRRSLPPDELLLVNDHLFSCDSCFERFDPEPVSIRDINSLLLGPDDHPDEDTLYERMEGYVDHKLSPGERREFQGHIEKCEACREEVADLLLLREALLDDPAFVPNEQPPPAVPKSHAQPRRLFNTWGVALAAAAVLLFIASAVLIFHLKRETNVLDARVQSLTQE
ncbi:MAG TPA: zf-HC2 domain-containing protein, partial [Blastocatellia bacterium]